MVYQFTREQLSRILNDAILMFIELYDDRDPDATRDVAVTEIFDGLDADRELVAFDPTERLRLQLPVVEQADASAPPYEANSKALS